MRKAQFIGAEIFRKPAFGNLHPLSISRLSAVEDVCSALGWFPDGAFVEAGPVSIETLTRFHHRDYVEALEATSASGKVSAAVREKFGFGTMENPIFPGLFERASTTVGGAIIAAQIAVEGGVGVHFGGGTHHGRPDRASGFCYFNDPVFAILTLLDAGLSRVAYVDLDAHHGDGVEGAFEEDSRVLTASIHEEDRWPHSGELDRCGSIRNAAVPAGFNDAELRFLMSAWLAPILDAFEPQAIVVTCGADALLGDPLSNMQLSNRALQDAVMALVARTPHAVVLGGGGYNPWTTVRAWAGLWGRLAGYPLPERLPPKIASLFETFECDLVDEDEIDPRWLAHLDDTENEGPVREKVRTLVSSSSY